MSKTARASLHAHYVLGLLSGSKSVTDMAERGLLPFGKLYTYRLLAHDPTPHKDALARRLAAAPQSAYLAVDLLKVERTRPNGPDFARSIPGRTDRGSGALP